MAAVIAGLCWAGASRPARAEEKLIILDSVPPAQKFEVSADGSKLYMAGAGYDVFDAKTGEHVDHFGTPQASAPRDLFPIADGWFIAVNCYAGGHIALVRPDGTEAKILVAKGGGAGGDKLIHSDNTGWSSPDGAAVDVEHKKIFVLDATQAPAGEVSPDWSRIAVWDFDGKYLSDIVRYDSKAKAPPDKDENLHTQYSDIEVDPQRQRVYVTANKSKTLVAYGYDGKKFGEVPGTGGIAVFKDGRIAVGTPAGGVDSLIQIYDADLKPVKTVASSKGLGLLDLEADDEGNLYASPANDRRVTFIKWGPDLDKSQSFGPRYLRITTEAKEAAVEAGKPFTMTVSAEGRPEPKGHAWQVMMRPLDGSDLRWQKLPVQTDGKAPPSILEVTVPATFNGFYEAAVRFGEGETDRTDFVNDPTMLKTFAFFPPGARQSIAVFPAAGRRVYRQGEAIGLQVARRMEQSPLKAGREITPVAEKISVRLALTGGVGEGKEHPAVGKPAQIEVSQTAAVEIPGAITARLAPGKYVLSPQADGYEAYALAFEIAPSEADSPMQRIMYHEFGSNALETLNGTIGLAEQREHLREWTEAAHRLGFTRETDRSLLQGVPPAWNRSSAPVDLSKSSGFATAEFYDAPTGGWAWEYYLDRSTRLGINFDSQLLDHCGGVPVAPSRFAIMVPKVQWAAQWWGRFPSFYGYNWNDELFFGEQGFSNSWTKDDTKWNKQYRDEKKDLSEPAYRNWLMSRMYSMLDEAAREANPRLHETTTPMWQYPACEGSYPPVLYKDLSESYSHWISEGYTMPWYPAHSVENLKRPGKPMMGVFDNGYNATDCSGIYMKNAMQVMARGVQGMGSEHITPFSDPRGSTAFAATNAIAKMYGPIFAQTPLKDEGVILYSWTQDVTEKRNMMGTPHWERVYELFGTGQMAGLPLGIVYEEDIEAGTLLPEGRDGKPRVGKLFLVGQKEALPAKVREQIDAFMKAGGKVYYDADSSEYAGGTKLDMHTHELGGPAKAGYSADSWWPLMMPVLEQHARDLNAALGKDRDFAIDTDDPWVSKNHFDGGAVQYVMLATETSPYPWDAGTVWSTGAMYSKGQFGNYLPKTVHLTFPANAPPGQVVYDVFEHQVVGPKADGNEQGRTVDLTTFPGRLFAMAPAVLGSPKVRVATANGQVDFEATLVDQSGKTVAARVPLRVKLASGDIVAAELYRGTDGQGVLRGSIPLPATSRTWTLEVTELLGAKGSVAEINSDGELGEVIRARSDVEIERQPQLQALLESSRGKLTLVANPPSAKLLSEAQIKALTDALAKRNIEVKQAGAMPKDISPGIYLTVGETQEPGLMGDMNQAAANRGLFEAAVGPRVPGPGRAIISPIYAPRGQDEHTVAIVAGDAAGMEKAIDVFAAWVSNPLVEPALALNKKAEPPSYTITAQPAERAGGVSPLAKLSDQVGVKLSGIVTSADGKHLVVTADGYQQNIALIEDRGDGGEGGNPPLIVQATRIGQSPVITSPFVSDDGKLFGASARTVARIGEDFHLIAADSGQGGERQVFAAYGEMGRTFHHFAATSSGDTVLVPGTFGIACWKNQVAAKIKTTEGGSQTHEWKQAWSIDYWKEFNNLDWPVDAMSERIPQFHVYIPRGADYAIVVFDELTQQGWCAPNYFSKAYVAAVNLSDGKERWRFDVPLPKTQVWPTLFTSPDGKKLVLQVQAGGWGKETFRFYSIADAPPGKALAQWDCTGAALDVAVANGSGRMAEIFNNRLLQVREADGKLVFNQIMPAQPVSVTFTQGGPDGEGLYVADQFGAICKLDETGKQVWQTQVGAVTRLAARAGNAGGAGGEGGVYAAGWDGRVRALSDKGELRWTLDCTAKMNMAGGANPMAAIAESVKLDETNLHDVAQPPTTSDKPPGPGEGENLLAGAVAGETDITNAEGKVVGKRKGARNSRAFVSVGGTPGWMSDGKVEVKAEQLVNGAKDDVDAPWLNIDEVFWDGQAGRQVYVDVAFDAPTDVHSLTVYENPKFKDSWPTEGRVQVWNEKLQHWDTAACGLFLRGPVNTYNLNLKAVTKLRYVPWNSYYKNFYTSEIEVR
jgi:hypothetical protein